MTRRVQSDIVLLVMELLTGERSRTIQAAKGLIAQSEDVDPELLSRVIRDPGYRPWSKVMAAYILGFLPIEADSQHLLLLRSVLRDRELPVRLRDFAAEALGNLLDQSAALLLSERMFDERESKLVRKSCVYALSQLHTSAASAALKRFAVSEPTGLLARELARAGVPSS